MSDWKRCTLADLGEVVGGATPSTKNESYYGGDIAWITPKDLSTFRGRFISHGERNITADGLKNSSARLMPLHSVLFTSRAPIGYVAIAENDICTNQGFKSIVPNNDTDYLFLYYLLVHNRDRIENTGSGTTFKEVSGSVMKQIEVFLPSEKAEQRAIAETLGALDDKIENNTKINHHLEQMTQAIFKSWFVNFEPWGGEMPNDWREGAISDIAADIVCGKTPSTKVAEYFGDDIPFITIPDMHGRTYVTTTERSLSLAGADSQSSKTVPADSVCVSCIATAGLVVLTSKPSQTNQQINTIVCKSEISPFYIYLTMVGMADHIRMLGSSGSATNNLNKGQFSKIEVLIPSTGVLDEFSEIVTPIFEEIKRNQQESERLAELRDALLPRLMSGELSVADLDAK